MDSYDVEVRMAAAPAQGDRLRWPMPEPSRMEIQFGSLRFPVRGLPAETSSPAVLTVDAAAHDISLPSGAIVKALRQESGSLRVGPVIGVLTAGHISRGRSTAAAPFDYQSYLFRHLAQVARRMRALLFAFEPAGIDWMSERINGWAYFDGRWLRVRMPVPDVVYNRVPNRRLESQPGVQSTLAGLRQSRVPVFNPQFIDKSRLYECLRADPEVSGYLPDTKPLQHHSQVTDVLAHNPIVYLKPRFGSLGNGIVRVERVGGRAVRIRFRRNNRNHSRLLPLGSLPQFVGELTRDRDYVCQQGIELPLYHGRPFDVRILTQKDGTGRWRLTGMGVRVAGAGSITTHVPSGGSIARIDRVLADVYGVGAARVAGNLRRAIATIAPAIEHGLHDDYGEFSMDLGADRNGDVWFFEANSKPHKFDEDHIRLLSWERTIEYAGYLAGFTGLGR